MITNRIHLMILHTMKCYTVLYCIEVCNILGSHYISWQCKYHEHQTDSGSDLIKDAPGLWTWRFGYLTVSDV